MAKRAACIDCKAPIPQPKGRGRPRLRCEECAWLAAKQQKREHFMREYGGVPADEAKEAALWYYGPPERDR
jgi:hypothetical protein